MLNPLGLRNWVYERFAETGRAPTRAEIDVHASSSAAASVLLRELHDRHLLVLDEHDNIEMALPFAAQPTVHRVVDGDRSWWANCAWDALAVPAALGADARIEATWLDTGRPVDLAVRNARLHGDSDGFVHFAIPARHWWDDIVET